MFEKITMIISLISLILSSIAIYLIIKFNIKLTKILKTKNTQNITGSASKEDNRAYRKSK